MGYTNPQRIIDQSFDTFTNASKRWVGQIAKTSDEIYQRNIREKEQQNLQWEKENKDQELMYSKVNELGSTGNSALDENIREFWDSRVQQYFEIKNAGSRGDMPRDDVNKFLGGINGQLTKFTGVIPYLASQIALQTEHGKLKPGTAGAIASTTSGESQDVIGSIAKGGNTAIVMKNNLMYFYNPPIEGKQDGAFMNIDEMLAKQAAGQDIVELVPDISKDLTQAYNNIYNPNDIDSKYVTIENKEKNGYNYEYKVYRTEDDDGNPMDAKTTGIQQMIDDGQFDPVIKDDRIMTSVWQDMIPDDYIEQYAKDNGMDINPNSSWGQGVGDDIETKEKFIADQQALAKQWLSEQAYDQNATLDNKMEYISRTKIPKPPEEDNKNPGRILYSEDTAISAQLYEDTKDNYQSGDQVWVVNPKHDRAELLKIE